MGIGNVDLQGKKVVVVNSGHSVGWATARHLASLGATVTLVDRDEERVKKTAADVGGAARCVAWHVCEFSARTDVQAMFAEVEAGLGGIDVLVINAATDGIISGDSAGDLSETDSPSHVGYVEAYYCLNAAIPLMVRRGGGKIINLGSGFVSDKQEAGHTDTSFGSVINTLGRSIEMVHGDRGIKIVGLHCWRSAAEGKLGLNASGFNPVSLFDPSVAVVEHEMALAVGWFCTEEADRYFTGNISLCRADIRHHVGLCRRQHASSARLSNEDCQESDNDDARNRAPFNERSETGVVAPVLPNVRVLGSLMRGHGPLPSQKNQASL